jgi:hypothetical protein
MPHSFRAESRLPLARPDKPDQCFEVVKFVVIAHDAAAVIDNPRLFIALQTVQQCFNAVSPCKFRKRARLELVLIEPLAALRGLAFTAPRNALFEHAFPVFAPFGVPAP